MLPRDEPAAPDMTPRNRGERRAAARAVVRKTCAQRRALDASGFPLLACVGMLDAFRRLSATPLSATQPLRVAVPAASPYDVDLPQMPAGLSRPQRRAWERATFFWWYSAIPKTARESRGDRRWFANDMLRTRVRAEDRAGTA